MTLITQHLLYYWDCWLTHWHHLAGLAHVIGHCRVSVYDCGRQVPGIVAHGVACFPSAAKTLAIFRS